MKLTELSGAAVWPFDFSARADLMRSSMIRELLRAASIEGMIALAGGLPGMLPVELVRSIVQDILGSSDARRALQYAPTEGYLPLLDAYVEYLVESEAPRAFHSRRQGGRRVEVSNVAPTVGSQQGLSVIAEILVNPGDAIIVGCPTYAGALSAFVPNDPLLLDVPLDEQGMVVDKVEELLEKHGDRVKLIYVVPDFQNPAGVSLSMERRIRLLELAKRHRVFIVEDSPYRRLYFNEKSLSSLWSMDEEGNTVIALRSTSKEWFVGRLGFLIGPVPIVQKVLLNRQGRDLCGPALIQHIYYRALRDGVLDSWNSQCRQVYARRRDVMIAAIQREMAEWPEAGCNIPQGGMFLWLRFPKRGENGQLINSRELNELAASRHLVMGVPSMAFQANDGPANFMRLNFSYCDGEQIEEGIRRLAEAFRQYRTL